MKNAMFKRLFSLTVVLILCLGLFVPANAAKTETKYGVASELVTGVYSIVVPNVTPTGMSGGAYYIDHDTAVNPGFKFAAFDKENPEGAAVWKITRISDTQCTIQNESKGAQGYINIGADTIGYGPEMKLNYEFAGGKCKFFVTVGGQNWYIRFTNSNRNESRFQSGTGTASHEFHLYGTITEEVVPELVIPPVTGDPILTVACISDLHADYGLEKKSPYVRGSVITTVNAIASEENADILLVGGDNTSDNARTGGWPYATFMNVIEQYRDLSYAATESGRSLWACGNHDYQAGVAEGYDSYAAYEDIMGDTCGEPLAVLRQKDDKSLDQKFPEYLLGIHYNVEGFDFIVINAPYSKSQTYSAATISWLNERLKTIGSSKTTFLLTHFPLTDSNNISTPSYGVSGSSYTSLTNVLKKFPNVIYLYGHNHGNGESVYISDDTFERITSYTSAGSPVTNRNVVPTSFITSFMGSMSYYKCSFNTDWLNEDDPKVIQALMIYVYKDRIVFQMKNYGEYLSNVTPLSWTVMRDLSSYVPGSSGSGGSSGAGSSGSGGSSGSYDPDDYPDGYAPGEEPPLDTDSGAEVLSTAASAGTSTDTLSGTVDSDTPADGESDGTVSGDDGSSSDARGNDGEKKDPDRSDGDSSEGLPGWAIAVIIVAGVLIVGGAGVGVWLIFARKKRTETGVNTEGGSQ